ncbi:hypothetical protein GCM10009525_70180 [Streptosporangium amethystogenes subsp. fukuiense]
MGSGGGFRFPVDEAAKALASRTGTAAGTTDEVSTVSVRTHPAVTMCLRDMSLSSTPASPDLRGPRICDW